jgi:hypothetical protein
MKRQGFDRTLASPAFNFTAGKMRSIVREAIAFIVALILQPGWFIF